MKLIRLTAIIILCLGVSITKAQTIEEADKYYDEWKAAYMDNNVEVREYDLMYKAYQAYCQAMKPLSSTSQDYFKCKSRLLNIFPFLAKAAQDFSDMNQKDKSILFAQAYVDLSLMPAFADDNLKSRPEYPLFVYFSAYTACVEKKNYQDAIKFYQVYLETGDQKYREYAYQGLVYSYFELYNYDSAKYFASQAVDQYPYNKKILYMGIKSCLETKDDETLALLLNNALEVEPDTTNLHAEYQKDQARMYERQKKYDEALACYQKLYGQNPSGLDENCHLAFNNYNAGVILLENAELMPIASDAAACRNQAVAKFRAALPYLEDILNNNVWAANVAHAIAECYNVISNKEKLDEANKDLTRLKVKTVKMGEMPTIEQNYRPEANMYTGSTNEGDFVSTVDENIPVTNIKNNNTYAIIIGNEHYKNLSKRDVEFANSDATSFSQYCQKTLGIPKDNIRLKLDATLGEISDQVSFLRERSKMDPDQLNFIFYYAGHGIPDTKKCDAYMLPSDATGNDLQYCYSLAKLYKEFDDSKAKQVVVFLDACFSGASRDGGMVLKERYIELAPEEPEVTGKTIIFSATQGDQTALQYDDEHHGFFTFYLLQNLQESKGAITLSDLAGKLSKQVDSAVYNKKSKHQNPKVNAAASLGDSWKNKSLLNL